MTVGIGARGLDRLTALQWVLLLLNLYCISLCFLNIISFSDNRILGILELRCGGMGRDGGGDERHHGLVRRLRVRRLHRLGWIKSQERPRHRVCPRELRRVPSSTVPRHLLSRQRTKSSLYDQVRGGWEIVVGAKAKAWTLGKLAIVYAWMSSAQSFQDLRAVDWFRFNVID